MNDLTLESLAKQVEALEKVIATKGPDQSRKDWRKVVGMFRGSEFLRKVDEECLRTREPEREAAQRGEFEPISKECRARESRTGWTDGTSGWECGGKRIASPFPSC